MSKHQSRKTVDSPDKKPSVFERLGCKSSARYTLDICSSWLKHGTCPLGKTCKLAQTHFYPEKMKKTVAKKSLELTQSRSITTPDPPVYDRWDFGDLEGADEKALQKRRLQLQRELRLQLKKEKGSKKKQKKSKKVSSSSSSSTSSSTSSSSSSTDSSAPRRRLDRKRKASQSSGSDASPRLKKRLSPKTVGKSHFVTKRKADSPRKSHLKKNLSVKKTPSPSWERRPSPLKKKSPVKIKQRAPSPKHKPREPSPRRTPKSKERRTSPPRVARPRSPDRKRHHSPRSRREAPRETLRGGLEKGGKILPVKSAAYVKEMKGGRQRTLEPRRDDKEIEKEKRRREQKTREMERREREREAERSRREIERKKEREDALERARDRQRERERTERLDREKRLKEDSRKPDKNDLPSLLDIKTEAPSREPSRKQWEDRPDRRPRRDDDNFEFRRIPRDGVETADARRGRHDFPHEPVDFREPLPGEWQRDWKPRYEPKWAGDGNRESGWRDHYGARRPPDWHTEPPPPTEELHRASDFSSAPVKGDRVHWEEEPIVPAPLGETIEEAPRRAVLPPVAIAPAEAAVDLEEALSDISDDPDDILNQVEEHPLTPPEAIPPQLPPVCISQQSAEFYLDPRRSLLECLGERGFDFEEISDEELQEDAKMGKGIMDVLGADWASLMQPKEVKSAKAEVSGSGLRRWRVDSIISRTGISYSLAGKEFTEKYLAKIRAKFQEAETSVKEEITKVSSLKEETPLQGENGLKVEVKEEIDESRAEKPTNTDIAKVELIHTVPAIHSYLTHGVGASPVQSLLSSRFKGALSARTDLSLRRVLCGLSPKEPLHFTACDEKLYESSVAMFQSAAA